MTTEELKVKISVDNSEAIAKVKQTKKALGDMGESTKAGTQGAAAGFQELRDSMDQVRSLQFADIILENLDSIKSSVALAKEEISMIFSPDFWKGAEIHSLGDAFGTLKTQGTEAFKSIRNAAKALKLDIIALVGTVIAFIGLIRNAITMSKELKISLTEATKIGLDVNTYREWGYILGYVGLEADKLADFFKTLADEQNAVRDGTEESIAAFAQLGISAGEVVNMTQGELFERTIRSLQGIESQVERTSLAYRIFGEEDAANLMPILKLNNQEMEKLITNYQLLGGQASDSLINKSSILQGSLHNLGTAWIGLKNTLAEAFMPAITWVVNKLTQAIAIINMFVKAIFGFELIAKSGDSSLSSAGASVGGYTNSVNEATSAVQKLKREAMGFDELNILPGADSSGGSGGAGSSVPDYSGGGGISIPDTSSLVGDLDLGKWKQRIDEWGNTIRAIVPLALVGVGGVGMVLAALSGNWITAIVCAGLAGIGLLAMTSGAGGFQGYVDSFATACKGLLVPAAIGIGAVGAVFFGLHGNWVGVLACAGLAGLGLYASTSDKFGGLTNGFAKHMATLVSVALIGIGAVGAVVCLLSGNIPGAILFGAMAGVGIAGVATTTSFFSNLGNNLKKWGENLVRWFKDTILPFFTKQYWVGLWDTIRNATSEKLSEIKSAISNKWGEIKKWFKTEIAPKFTKEYWRNQFDSIKSAAAAKLDEVGEQIFKGKWNGIKKWFNSEVKPKFTTTYWKDKFSSIASGAKAAFNSVISIVESAINGIISKINTLSWKIPDWVPKYGGSKFGFNLSQVYIPRLATGGIAMNDTLAHIGEGGFREAVLPLDRNTQWMDSLADKLASKMGGSGNAPTKVVLSIDGRELGWATINNINAITKQTGDIQLVL